MEQVVADADGSGDKSTLPAPELGRVGRSTTTPTGMEGEPCEVLHGSEEVNRVRDTPEVGMGAHEGGSSELAESLERVAVGRKGPPDPSHEGSPRREVVEELIPGVPFPEWRRAVLPPVAPSAVEGNAAKEPTRVIADQLPPTMSYPSLWFPPILSSRHRAMMHSCATQRGLGHRSVDAADGRQLIVWDVPIVLQKAHQSSTARSPSDSCHSRLASTPDVLPPALNVDGAGGKGDGAKPCPGKGNPEQAAFPQVTKNGETVHQGISQSLDAVVIDLTCAGSSTGVDQPPDHTTRIPEDTGTRQSAVSSAGHFEITDGGSLARAEADGSHTPRAEPPTVKTTDDCTRQGRPSPGLTPGVQASTSILASGPESAQSHDSRIPPMQNAEEAEEVVVLEGHPTSGATATDDRVDLGEACFLLVGAVDGIAEEVIDAPEDADTWEFRRVVVEVKNRMGRVKHPPPLYDQIQLVVSVSDTCGASLVCPGPGRWILFLCFTFGGISLLIRSR